MARAHSEPLSASERATLADLLAERGPYTGGLTLDAAQGLIAGALSGPEPLPERAWLRHVLGTAVAGDGAPDAARRWLAALYSESPSRFVVSVKPEHRARFEELLGGQALRIGATTAEPRLRISGQGRRLVDAPVAELEQAWRKELLA